MAAFVPLAPEHSADKAREFLRRLERANVENGEKPSREP
jgi:hypothetical protein